MAAHENVAPVPETKYLPVSRRAHGYQLNQGEEGREERRLVRRYIRGTWAGNWWNMLGSNVIACVRDTGAGIRRVKLKT